MRKDIKLFLIPFIIVCFIGVCYSSCSGENDIYKTYEMKSDDMRLSYLNHPLYTFEYPEFFNLIDLNPNFIYSIPKPRQYLTGGPPMDGGMSIVDFTFSPEDLPKASLSVIIVAQEYVDMFDTNDMFELYLSSHTPTADNINIKEVLVFGIPADYMESFSTVRNIKPIGIVEEYRMSARVVVFNYADLIWAIQMFWYYHEPEPPEIEEYFNHVIETFEIFDARYENSGTDDELDITVTWDNKTFTITNNGDVTLCEIELFLNYIDEDLSTGYHYSSFDVIPPNHSRQIGSRDFKNTSGKRYVYYDGNEPFILLVQAEYPGCKNKVYTYTQIWN